ncbi:unnamed protein product [Vitrella brassicaformis CCMP3155]|uniref:Uncharacterized protein n=1 Tax=Vitrella brassicaformis (strain CCMP3155) TaxID=1169540 RepID=A0A0G4GWJ2_VITBC|nr:unnamed protein product [Vitrella brassicaformis CCMP3155]|eukprot:CEM35307.1 unnamed protein product [Vitrella brassicaformis CCMP3155]
MSKPHYFVTVRKHDNGVKIEDDCVFEPVWFVRRRFGRFGVVGNDQYDGDIVPFTIRIRGSKSTLKSGLCLDTIVAELKHGLDSSGASRTVICRSSKCLQKTGNSLRASIIILQRDQADPSVWLLPPFLRAAYRDYFDAGVADEPRVPFITSPTSQFEGFPATWCPHGRYTEHKSEWFQGPLQLPIDRDDSWEVLAIFGEARDAKSIEVTHVFRVRDGGLMRRVRRGDTDACREYAAAMDGLLAAMAGQRVCLTDMHHPVVLPSAESESASSAANADTDVSRKRSPPPPSSSPSGISPSAFERNLRTKLSAIAPTDAAKAALLDFAVRAALEAYQETHQMTDTALPALANYPGVSVGADDGSGYPPAVDTDSFFNSVNPTPPTNPYAEEEDYGTGPLSFGVGGGGGGGGGGLESAAAFGALADVSDEAALFQAEEAHIPYPLAPPPPPPTRPWAMGGLQPTPMAMSLAAEPFGAVAVHPAEPTTSPAAFAAVAADKEEEEGEESAPGGAPAVSRLSFFQASAAVGEKKKKADRAAPRAARGRVAPAPPPPAAVSAMEPFRAIKAVAAPAAAATAADVKREKAAGAGKVKVEATEDDLALEVQRTVDEWRERARRSDAPSAALDALVASLTSGMRQLSIGWEAL